MSDQTEAWDVDHPESLSIFNAAQWFTVGKGGAAAADFLFEHTGGDPGTDEKLKKSGDRLDALLKYNGAHYPAGSSRGGQFAPKNFNPAATNSPEFKAWFGDSKVRWSDGTPMVVYHGTASDFSSFDPEMVGLTFGVDRMGFFFTMSPMVAGGYADAALGRSPFHEEKRRRADPMYGERDSNEEPTEPVEMGQNIMPVYLRMENPLIIRSKEGDDATTTMEQEYGTQNLIDEAKSKGYDGLIIIGNYRTHVDGYVRDMTDDMFVWDDKAYQKRRAAARKNDLEVRARDRVFVVFKPEQIKSAIGNRGAFSRRSKDITKSSDRLAGLLAKYNRNHYPAGSSKGGQFAPSGRGVYPVRDDHDEMTIPLRIDATGSPATSVKPKFKVWESGARDAEWSHGINRLHGSTADRLISHLNKLVDEHPILGTVAVISPTKKDFEYLGGQDGVGAFYNGQANTIVINPDVFNSENITLMDRLDPEAYGIKWMSDNPSFLVHHTPESILTHEMGHAFLFLSAKSVGAKNDGAPLVMREVGLKLKGTKAFKEDEGLVNPSGLAPSRYALIGGPHEFFAEAFTATKFGKVANGMTNKKRRLEFAHDLVAAVSQLTSRKFK